MRLRRSTVEHPFGTLKYRIFGHPRLLLRGLSGAKTEIGIAVMAYNLKRMINLNWRNPSHQGDSSQPGERDVLPYQKLKQKALPRRSAFVVRSNEFRNSLSRVAFFIVGHPLRPIPKPLFQRRNAHLMAK